MRDPRACARSGSRTRRKRRSDGARSLVQGGALGIPLAPVEARPARARDRVSRRRAGRRARGARGGRRRGTHAHLRRLHERARHRPHAGHAPGELVNARGTASAIIGLALLLPATASAAEPADTYARKVGALHRASHAYPADARQTTACSGYRPYRTMQCKVTVRSASMVNGGEVWRYVATGNIIRSGRNWRIQNFKAYVVGGIG